MAEINKSSEGVANKQPYRHNGTNGSSVAHYRRSSSGHAETPQENRRSQELFSAVEVDKSQPYPKLQEQTNMRTPEGLYAHGVQSDGKEGFDMLKIDSIARDPKSPFKFEKNGDVVLPGDDERGESRFKNYEALKYDNAWSGEEHYLRGTDNKWDKVSAEKFKEAYKQNHELPGLSDTNEALANKFNQEEEFKMKEESTFKELRSKKGRTRYENLVLDCHDRIGKDMNPGIYGMARDAANEVIESTYKRAVSEIKPANKPAKSWWWPF